MKNILEPMDRASAGCLNRFPAPFPRMRKIILSTLALLLGFTAASDAEGFRNPPPGAFNLGRAGGRIAHVDDASAATQNPANLMDLMQPEAQVSPNIVYISADFKSPTGQKAETKDPWKLLPNVFAYLPLEKGKLGAGLAVTTPYGLSVRWKESSPAFARGGLLRYTSPFTTEMTTINVSPNLAARLADNFQIGVGFDAMWSKVRFKQYYPWAAFPGSVGTEPDGTADLQADGWGFGANVGVTWEFLPGHRLAATWRTPVSLDYEGHMEIDNITPTAAAFGATARSPLQTAITFPTIIAVGYGVRLSDRLRVEADVEWLEFSNFKKLQLNAANNNFLFPSTTFPENWDNTFTAGFGFDWQATPALILRGGYQFYESPVPDGTLSPAIPDANQHVFTIGINFTWKRHAVEAAYGLDLYDDRDISNSYQPAFNGSYDITVHLLAFAYRYRF